LEKLIEKIFNFFSEKLNFFQKNYIFSENWKKYSTFFEVF